MEVTKCIATYKFKNCGYCDFDEYFEAAYIELRKVLLPRIQSEGAVYIVSKFQATYLINGELIPFLHSVGGQCLRYMSHHFDTILIFHRTYIVEEIEKGLSEFLKDREDCTLFDIGGLEIEVIDVEECSGYIGPPNFN